MARRIVLTDQGGVELLEAKANGTSRIILQAPAALAGDLTWTLPVDLPTAQQFLTIDSSGNIDHAAGASGTLDQAYDSGGAGNGRVITSDTGAVEMNGSGGLLVTTGPVEISGVGGLQLTHTDPALLFETTGVGDYNWRAQATSGDLLNFQRGDQDADVSDDTFDDVLTLDGANRRLGLNTNAPGTTAELVDAAASKLTLQAAAANDASVIFDQNGTAQFEVGYDQSAGGLVIGESSFANPVMFFEDTTFDVGIGELVPDARLHVTDGVEIVSLIESTTAVCRLALRASGSADATQVGIQASVDDLRLISNGAVSLTVGASGLLTATNWNITAAGAIAASGDAVIGSSSDTNPHSLTILAGDTADESIVNFGDSVSSTVGQIRYGHGADGFVFYTAGAINSSLGTNGLRIGTPAGAFSGTNAIIIENGTAPSTSPTASVTLYSEDVAASAELKVRDEAGNITVLSPHSEPHGHELSEDMAWSFYSKRDGRYVWVDMLRVVRHLERLTGEQLAFIGETA